MEEKLKEIEELIEKGDYDRAIMFCDSLISSNDSTPIIHLSEAIANYYLDNIEDAIEDINKEIKIFPKCPQLQYIYHNIKLKHNLLVGNYIGIAFNFMGMIFYNPKRKTSYVYNSTNY